MQISHALDISGPIFFWLKCSGSKIEFFQAHHLATTISHLTRQDQKLSSTTRNSLAIGELCEAADTAGCCHRLKLPHHASLARKPTEANFNFVFLISAPVHCALVAVRGDASRHALRRCRKRAVPQRVLIGVPVRSLWNESRRRFDRRRIRSPQVNRAACH
jgi:hypothetical protein